MANDDAWARYGRESINASADVGNGQLQVVSFGTYTRDWHGVVLHRALGMPILGSMDFELSVALDSGPSGYGEVMVVLVNDVGQRVGGVAWISSCGTGKGNHHFLGQPADGTALEGLYVGCSGSEAPEFSGTLALQRRGTTWISTVDGDVVHETETACGHSGTATGLEILMTKPFDFGARPMTVDEIKVSVFVPS